MISDPMEQMIADALTEANIPFNHEVPTGHRAIDFYLPTLDLYIEVKQFYSDRTSDQMSVCENIIVVQGRGAVQALARLILHSI